MSFGLKPKAKDLKSVIEDLRSMEYLNTLDNYESTVVLDGRKVRIGFEGDKIDPFYKTYEEQGDILKSIA